MEKYILENEFVLIEFLDLGGCITKMINKRTDTNYVLHYEDDHQYNTNPYYLGATIGRNAGRTFPPHYLNARHEKVVLDVNEGKVHLHGGKDGLHRKIWNVEQIDSQQYRLSYQDQDSLYEEMDFQIVYRLEKNFFILEMIGTAEQATISNLTNHSYFNLNKDKEPITEHVLETSPARIQLIDENFIPTEEYSDMSGQEYWTFDFSSAKKIKEALKTGTELSKICADGIDLAYCFKERRSDNQIKLTDSQQNNRLIITTDQEACVIYTLNKISAPIRVNNGTPIEKYLGITFEMQRRPNYVHNDPDYLEKEYHSRTQYEII